MRFPTLRRLSATAATAMLLGGMAGCSLDVSNPNSADEERVLTSREGLLATAVSLQQYYANTVLPAIVLTPGVTVGEAAVTSTFLNLIELEQGEGTLNGLNANVASLWSRPLRVVGVADQMLASTPSVTMDPATKSGLDALAKLYKAMALGVLAQNFEQAPTTTSTTGATFVPRAAVFTEAVRLLTEAEQTIAATPPSAEFTSVALVPGLDLLNTIRAYKARFLLFSGQYQAAADAAAAVSATARSEFRYDATSTNPIFATAYTVTSTVKEYAARDSLGLRIVPGDQRVAFYTEPISARSTALGLPVDKLKGFWTSTTSPIPAYLPDEMRLIRAEAFARLNRLPEALAELNAVRTQAPSADPFGVGGGLPAFAGTTQAEILAAIYYERSAELYLQGLRLEDNRRFGFPAPGQPGATRTRNFYPYPTSERDNNPNTPPDPVI